MRRLSTFAEGYVNAHRIVDENRAEAIVQIPGSGSRDQFDYQFFTKDGIEYLQGGGDLYVSAEAAGILEDGMTVTIGEDGYTEWLSIPAALEGKTLTVSTEADGVFVYNTAMLCQYNRVTDGDQPVTLPAGGYLGLAGDPQAVFTITISD